MFLLRSNLAWIYLQTFQWSLIRIVRSIHRGRIVGLDGKVSDSRHRQMEERHVSAFKPIECATVLDGSEAVSTERYPIADIARWRKGTSPHSNRLNAETCLSSIWR